MVFYYTMRLGSSYIYEKDDKYLALLSFPLALNDLRAPEPLTARPAFRRPEFVSLEAAVNVETEPDFASSARTAGIPKEPLGAVCSFLRVVDLTISMFEGSSLDLFLPLVCGSSSAEDPRISSESELS